MTRSTLIASFMSETGFIFGKIIVAYLNKMESFGFESSRLTQSLLHPAPYPNAHANVKKWVFGVQFPRNCFEFGILLNDFWSSTIWAIQTQVSKTELKNPKIPGIQPMNVKIFPYLVKMKIQTWVYIVYLNDLENLEETHLEMCKDVKSGYNYSCHHGGNDDSSNHIVSFSSVEFVIDECKVSEVNRLCQGSMHR